MTVLIDKFKIYDLPGTPEQVNEKPLEEIVNTILRIASGDYETLGHANFKMNSFLAYSAIRLAKDYAEKNNLSK